MLRKITRIDIIPIEIELNEPFSISVGSIAYAQNTVVKIFTDDNTYGTGECGRFRSIHAETPQGVFEAGKFLAPFLLGLDATNIRHCVSVLDKNFVGHASIKCAFDMALYDLNAKLLNIPLYQFLAGKHDLPIFTDMTIGLMDIDQMVNKSLEYKQKGFPSLKIKLGDTDGQKDVHRIKAIRKAIGYDIPLRIDANQGWNYLTAKTVLSEIATENIQYCEAPIDASNFSDLIRLSRDSAVPIMGDESVFSHKDAYRMLANQCIDLVNIKLGKSGGIYHAMQIASVTAAADVSCQVGCFAETRVGISALIHFASVWPHIIYHDLDSPLMHTEDPVLGGFKYQKNWSVFIDDSPGHGARFTEDFLERFEKFTCIA